MLTSFRPPVTVRQILERLVRDQWNSADGLGALIISPTRELVGLGRSHC